MEQHNAKPNVRKQTIYGVEISLFHTPPYQTYLSIYSCTFCIAWIPLTAHIITIMVSIISGTLSPSYLQYLLSRVPRLFVVWLLSTAPYTSETLLQIIFFLETLTRYPTISLSSIYFWQALKAPHTQTVCGNYTSTYLGTTQRHLLELSSERKSGTLMWKRLLEVSAWIH